MSVAVASDERSFFSTYVKLMEISPNAPAHHFYTTADYGSLKSLGPSLPTIHTPMPPAVVIHDDGMRLIDVSFKSIKPPFKFNTEVSGVNPSTTIFKLKNVLINSLPLLKDAGVGPQDIKLMLKSKVMNDTATISSVLDSAASKLSFGCLVKAPAIVEKVSEPTSNPPLVSPITWARISQVLNEDIADKERAAQIYSAFKRSVEDTVLTLD